MAEEKTITQESFGLLLKWLGPDDESASNKYETIRQRLIRIFLGRGCHEAEMLTDRTIDRVIGKIHDITGTYKGDPSLFFFGVANNIHHEWLRQNMHASDSTLLPTPHDDGTDREPEYKCLEQCLAHLPYNLREMILEYYSHEKRAKIECRKQLAVRLGITIGALQVKVSRVRSSLSSCVRKCVSENDV